MGSLRKSWLWGITALILVFILATALAACGGSDQETSTTTESSATSTSEAATTTTTLEAPTTTTVPTTLAPSTTTTKASTRTTSEALSSAETQLADGTIKGMGYIDRVWEEEGVRYLSIDYVELLTGEEAIQAAIDAGEIQPGEDLPNDYFIRNQSEKKRQFKIAASAAILTATKLGGSPDQPEPVSWEEFQSYWSETPPEGAEHLHLVPWWIIRDGATVINIAEQYLP